MTKLLSKSPLIKRKFALPNLLYTSKYGRSEGSEKIFFVFDHSKALFISSTCAQISHVLTVLSECRLRWLSHVIGHLSQKSTYISLSEATKASQNQD